MKNKIWPYSIILVFILFVAFIINFVVRSVKSEIHLVRPDYYQQELAYQETIDMESNLNRLGADFKISHDTSSENLTIEIPKDISLKTGTLKFYRPSNKNDDFTQSLSSHNKQGINLKSVKPGLWQVEVYFESKEGTKYFRKEKIFIE